MLLLWQDFWTTCEFVSFMIRLFLHMSSNFWCIERLNYLLTSLLHDLISYAYVIKPFILLSCHTHRMNNIGNTDPCLLLHQFYSIANWKKTALEFRSWLVFPFRFISILLFCLRMSLQSWYHILFGSLYIFIFTFFIIYKIFHPSGNKILYMLNLFSH